VRVMKRRGAPAPSCAAESRSPAFPDTGRNERQLVSGRLPSGLLVGAMLRRVNDAGGIGTMLARGDEQAGAILIIALEKGLNPRIWERGIGPSGAAELISVGPQAPDNEAEIYDYWRRRRARDPDLWVIELDIAQAERFAAETMSEG